MSLAELRDESGLKAKKIAEWLGITYRQYHNIECGQAKLDKLKAEKLSEIFHLSTSEIKNSWKEGTNDEQTS